MASFNVERKINLPIEKEWSVMSDFTQSPAPDIKVEAEKEGETEAGGQGNKDNNY